MGRVGSGGVRTLTGQVGLVLEVLKYHRLGRVRSGQGVSTYHGSGRVVSGQEVLIVTWIGSSQVTQPDPPRRYPRRLT